MTTPAPEWANNQLEWQNLRKCNKNPRNAKGLKSNSRARKVWSVKKGDHHQHRLKKSGEVSLKSWRSLSTRLRETHPLTSRGNKSIATATALYIWVYAFTMPAIIVCFSLRPDFKTNRSQLASDQASYVCHVNGSLAHSFYPTN